MTLSGGFGVCGMRNGAFWRRPGCAHCTQAGRDAATTVVSLFGWETDRSLSGGWTWTAADRRRGTRPGVRVAQTPLRYLRHSRESGKRFVEHPPAVPLLWGGFLLLAGTCGLRAGLGWRPGRESLGVAVWDFFCCLLAFLLFGVIVHYNTRSPTTAGWAPPATLAKWS